MEPTGITSLHAIHPWEDFRNFAFDLWAHLNLPSPTPVQYDICSYLQHGPRRRMVQAFRGVGKSFLTAGYVCWLLWKDPQHKVMVVSASKERADAFSVFVKQIIETFEPLSHLRPRSDQRNSNLAFDVGPALPDQSPSVKSVGITGQLTGSRANTIIPDDIEVVKNSQTIVQREKLAELIKEFDAVLKPGGQVIFLGTPQTEESLYNKLPARGYDIRIWPARFPKDLKQRIAYGALLAPMIAELFDENPGVAWMPTDSRRFDEADLLEREASYGRSGFALQFMLDTTLSDAEKYPLKLGDFIVMDVDRDVAPIRVVWASGKQQVIEELPSVGFSGDRWHSPLYLAPEMEEYTGALMTVDPSGRGSDETGYCVTKILRGMIYLRRSGGFKGGYDTTTLEGLAHIARAEKVQHILVESNFGDGMFNRLFEPVLKRIYPCSLEEIRHTTAKERRICDTVEPVLNQHRLVVDKALIRADADADNHHYQLFHQLSRMTRDRGAVKHDDRVEPLAMALAYWADQLARNVEDEESRRAEELQDQDYLDFIQAVTGRAVDEANFYDNF